MCVCLNKSRFSIMDNFIEVLNALQLIEVWIFRRIHIIDIEEMIVDCHILSSFLSYLTVSLAAKLKNKLISEVFKIAKNILTALLQQQKLSNQTLLAWLYCTFSSSIAWKIANLLRVKW